MLGVVCAWGMDAHARADKFQFWFLIVAWHFLQKIGFLSEKANWHGNCYSKNCAKPGGGGNAR